MRDRINAVDLLGIPAGTKIAWWIEFGSFAGSLPAVEANPDSIDWQTIVRVEDDDTHVIVTIGSGQWAVNKRHHVVIDTGNLGAVS